MKKVLKVFALGAAVEWQWMGRFIVGSVTEIHTKSVSKTIKGKLIKRNGTNANPAYLVQSKAGNFALKLHTELRPSEMEVSGQRRPKMFSKPD